MKGKGFQQLQHQQHKGVGTGNGATCQELKESMGAEQQEVRLDQKVKSTFLLMSHRSLDLNSHKHALVEGKEAFLGFQEHVSGSSVDDNWMEPY